MASEISKNILPENPDELPDKLKLLLQEKQTGKHSEIKTEEIVAIAVKLLKYK